ncbi:MAG: hypothetical protein JGK26_28720 [Microcoleus sp. PH2017_27_LUM_O_A]|nr:hypothetical protein [Microcoleus sp. PH2017_27_LUM_O_A]
MLVIGHCQSHLSRTGKVYTTHRTLKKEEGRRKKEEGRRKKEEGSLL